MKFSIYLNRRVFVMVMFCWFVGFTCGVCFVIICFLTSRSFGAGRSKAVLRDFFFFFVCFVCLPLNVAFPGYVHLFFPVSILFDHRGYICPIQC